MSSAADRRRKAKALEEAGAALSVKLVARSTRGQRISELQGEDAEADETFWGQGAWQEKEEDDSEFSSEEGEREKHNCGKMDAVCILLRRRSTVVSDAARYPSRRRSNLSRLVPRLRCARRDHGLVALGNQKPLSFPCPAACSRLEEAAVQDVKTSDAWPNGISQEQLPSTRKQTRWGVMELLSKPAAFAEFWQHTCNVNGVCVGPRTGGVHVCARPVGAQ